MQDSDSLKVSISEIKYAKVYVQKAPARKYRYFSHLDAELTNSNGGVVNEAIFDTRKGWSIQIVVVGTSRFKGNFRAKIWIDKGYHPAQLTPSSGVINSSPM
jgi:hypothetical protein